MKNKKWLALSLAATMVLPLAACSSSGSSAGSDDSKAEGDAPAGETTEVTLKVWTPQEDQSDDYGNWLGQMEKNFEEAHPEYKITWTNEVCQEGDIGDKVTQDPTKSADVYLFANDQIGKLRDANAIAKLGGEALDAVKANNSEIVVNSVTQDDGVYGIPFTTNTWFMFYNKEMVGEDEVGNLDKILEKGTVYFPISNSWYLPAFFYADGGSMFGPNGTDAAAGVDFNKPEVTETLVNLVKGGKFKDDRDGAGYAAFTEGKAAAMFDGSWDYNNAKDALGDKLGVAQLPVVKIGDSDKQLKAFSGSKAIGVNPNAKNQKAAVDFASYLGSEEAQKAHWELRAVIPTNKNLLTAEIGNDPLVKAQNDTIDNTSVIQPTITAMGNYWTMGENFGKAIVAGDVTDANAVEQTQSFQDQLDTLKD